MNTADELEKQAEAIIASIEGMEETVAAEGRTVDGSKGQPVAHPLLGEIRASRLALMQILRALGSLKDSPTTQRAVAAAQARWGTQ